MNITRMGGVSLKETEEKQDNLDIKKDKLFNCIKASLWGGYDNSACWELYDEMKKQAIAVLPANYIFCLQSNNKVYYEWKKLILQQVAYYHICQYEQEHLAITVPYVVLKGLSVARYYPNPEYRMMGDIDIMTHHEDYYIACKELLSNGYIETTTIKDSSFGRHRSFRKNRINIEIHAFFAIMNDPQRAEWLDNLIIQNINPSHILPDLVNGLVILSHIDQHMEEGVGLRQIIDWMMFVDKCLSDDSWGEFKRIAEQVGLVNLALVLTRMCEIYLGLSIHRWCQTIDAKLCAKLMNYIISCGNFGVKHVDDTSARIRALTYARTPIAAIRYMQERGLQNWKATKKYRVLRPFAWIYQVIKNIKNRKKLSSKELHKEYDAAKERAMLFQALGTTQSSRGYTIYKNGSYVKTYKKP